MSIQIHAFINSDTMGSQALQIYDRNNDMMMATTFFRDNEAKLQIEEENVNLDGIQWSDVNRSHSELTEY